MKSLTHLLFTAGLLLAASPAPAQNLTAAQKEADFRYMVSLYNTYYGPLAWKNQLFQFNAIDLRPWLDRVSQTTSDLDFYEVCLDYIASLNDTHVGFNLPSDFVARLNFGVDIYDGLLLIDSLDRTRLPAATFPFVIGDELVSIDGEDANQLAERFLKYSPQGNPRAARRMAAQRLTIRNQSRMPHAPDTPDSSIVIIRRQNGDLETYTLPWTKTGTPLTVGPVPSPSPKSTTRQTVVAHDPLTELQYSGVSPEDTLGVNGYSARNPIFLAGLPSTFTRRLGGAAADFFYSGVFAFNGLRIGYIRIPNYSPPSTVVALQQFEAEILFMNENTDGLVIDEMRNGGGLLCFGEDLAVRLTPNEFQVTGFDIRAFWILTLNFYANWIANINAGSSASVIDQYEMLYREMLASTLEGRVVTKTVPVCTSSLTRGPVFDQTGVMLAYRKPILVIIDDFSTSTADSFPAMMQDSGRALLFGMRSNGAGGSNISVPAGIYSEANVGMTIALQSRPRAITAPDYPESKYIENVGVRPDIENDYMTKENLLGNGARFINDFLTAAANHIRGTR